MTKYYVNTNIIAEVIVDIPDDLNIDLDNQEDVAAKLATEFFAMECEVEFRERDAKVTIATPDDDAWCYIKALSSTTYKQVDDDGS